MHEWFLLLMDLHLDPHFQELDLTLEIVSFKRKFIISTLFQLALMKKLIVNQREQP